MKALLALLAILAALAAVLLDRRLRNLQPARESQTAGGPKLGGRSERLPAPRRPCSESRPHGGRRGKFREKHPLRRHSSQATGHQSATRSERGSRGSGGSATLSAESGSTFEFPFLAPGGRRAISGAEGQRKLSGASGATEGTGNRIAVERRKFNETVQAYNTAVQTMPAALFAGLLWLLSETIFYGPRGSRRSPAGEFQLRRHFAFPGPATSPATKSLGADVTHPQGEQTLSAWLPLLATALLWSLWGNRRAVAAQARSLRERPGGDSLASNDRGP